MESGCQRIRGMGCCSLGSPRPTESPGEWVADRLGLRPRVEDVTLRGSGEGCCVLWMLNSPRIRLGLGKEKNCNRGQLPRECRTRPFGQRDSSQNCKAFAQGIWKEWHGRQWHGDLHAFQFCQAQRPCHPGILPHNSDLWASTSISVKWG